MKGNEVPVNTKCELPSESLLHQVVNCGSSMAVHFGV